MVKHVQRIPLHMLIVIGQSLVRDDGNIIQINFQSRK